MRYQCARELFEAAREAMIDTVRCTRSLQALEEAQSRVAGGLCVGTVGGNHHGDQIGRIVSRTADRKEGLERRIEQNEAIIDVATEVLYGVDGMSDGLAELAPAWWADAIYHRYLNLMKWDDVSEVVGYHRRYVQACVAAAFELMDENGMAATVEGQGTAEG